ncbi:unnamed protein product [Amoebophrya sp. A25]|nr:unnamed protein product [Amoebophrya sp. A25]|eukprot:GSA25T00006645001.1
MPMEDVEPVWDLDEDKKVEAKYRGQYLAFLQIIPHLSKRMLYDVNTKTESQHLYKKHNTSNAIKLGSLSGNNLDEKVYDCINALQKDTREALASYVCQCEIGAIDGITDAQFEAFVTWCEFDPKAAALLEAYSQRSEEEAELEGLGPTHGYEVGLPFCQPCQALQRSCGYYGWKEACCRDQHGPGVGQGQGEC